MSRTSLPSSRDRGGVGEPHEDLAAENPRPFLLGPAGCLGEVLDGGSGPGGRAPQRDDVLMVQDRRA